MAAPICCTSAWKAEAGEEPVLGSSALDGKTLSTSSYIHPDTETDKQIRKDRRMEKMLRILLLITLSNHCHEI